MSAGLEVLLPGHAAQEELPTGPDALSPRVWDGSSSCGGLWAPADNSDCSEGLPVLRPPQAAGGA
jgi:hypothetical protein